MKPNIELTSKLHFAAWEGGGYTPNMDLGQSVLVASPEGEKLQVLFDRGPRVTNSPYQYLFIVDVGYLLAQVSLSKDTNTQAIKASVSLSRITALNTEQVQDQAVAKANTEVLFATRQRFDTEDQLRDLSYFTSDSAHKEQFKALLSAAISKALTARPAQTLFWGTPRST